MARSSSEKRTSLPVEQLEKDDKLPAPFEHLERLFDSLGS
jgi:hypothetical protein